MEKPKKEWILNIAFNRWHLNRPKYVGKLSEAIRACAPRSFEEWQEYYLREVPKKHVPPNWVKMGETMQEHLKEVGRRLYVKISEQLRNEVESITEEDCITYVEEVVLRRTFDGYQSERYTVYEQVQEYLHQVGLSFHIEPSPSEWEGKYNVDFYINIAEYINKKVFIGLQIKPISYNHFDTMRTWHKWMRSSHERFTRDFQGKVFIIFSFSKGKRKEIVNKEVLHEIAEEIKRLHTSN